MDAKAFFQEVYKNFNERNIDYLLTQMTPDVEWANGMEGGFVYGHEGVRHYWTNQFKILKPVVNPIAVTEEDGLVKVRVHQVVHDNADNLLLDREVLHLFEFSGDKVCRFTIGEDAPLILD